MTFPDLRPHFKHTEWRVMSHSRGELVCSDWTDKTPDDPIFGVFKQCGFWTMGEVKLLFDEAAAHPGLWLDVGGHTGWTAAHMAAAGCDVISVDPMYANPEFKGRALENLGNTPYRERVHLYAGRSEEFFHGGLGTFEGIVVDGDHVAPAPYYDAVMATSCIRKNGVVVFHDAVQVSVQHAIEFMIRAGWRVASFDTPHGVAVCSREGE